MELFPGRYCVSDPNQILANRKHAKITASFGMCPFRDLATLVINHRSVHFAVSKAFSNGAAITYVEVNGSANG